MFHLRAALPLANPMLDSDTMGNTHITRAGSPFGHLGSTLGDKLPEA